MISVAWKEIQIYSINLESYILSAIDKSYYDHLINNLMWYIWLVTLSFNNQ